MTAEQETRTDAPVVAATVAVHPAELDRLLRDALSCADDDPTSDGTPSPFLTGVLLHSDTHPHGGDALIGSATDRFQMVQASAQVLGRLPHRLWLTRVQVEQVLAALAIPLREDESGRSMALAQIAVKGLMVTVRMASDGGGSATVAVRFPADRGGQFPDVYTIARDSRATTSTSTGEFALDATRLARMADRSGGHRQMRLRSTGGGSGPVEVMIGDDYAGIIMPKKLGGEHNGTPPLWPLPEAQPAKAGGS